MNALASEELFIVTRLSSNDAYTSERYGGNIQAHFVHKNNLLKRSKKVVAEVIRLVKTIVRPLHRKLNLDILRRMKKEFWYTQLIMR